MSDEITESYAEEHICPLAFPAEMSCLHNECKAWRRTGEYVGFCILFNSADKKDTCEVGNKCPFRFPMVASCDEYDCMAYKDEKCSKIGGIT